jgi:hypothetical protein
VLLRNEVCAVFLVAAYSNVPIRMHLNWDYNSFTRRGASYGLGYMKTRIQTAQVEIS